MKRLDFLHELTALEIREPMMRACEEIAEADGFYARFDQGQQTAFTGNPWDRNRVRVGNGKHKIWEVIYQVEPVNFNPDRTHVIGQLMIRGPVDPANMAYGGFEYGKYGEPSPTYNYITIGVPSEHTDWHPRDPSPQLLAQSITAIEEALGVHPQLF